MNPFDLRLDAAVWTPTALGTVGPHNTLGDLAAGGGNSYRPLLAHHRRGGPLADGLDRVVELAARHTGSMLWLMRNRLCGS